MHNHRKSNIDTIATHYLPYTTAVQNKIISTYFERWHVAICSTFKSLEIQMLIDTDCHFELEGNL